LRFGDVGASYKIQNTSATDIWSISNDTGDVSNTGNLNLGTSKTYKINSTNVLSSTTLGSGVVNSSLTTVGVLSSLTVNGNYSFGTGQNVISNTTDHMNMTNGSGNASYTVYTDTSGSAYIGHFNSGVFIRDNNSNKIRFENNSGTEIIGINTAIGTSVSNIVVTGTSSSYIRYTNTSASISWDVGMHTFNSNRSNSYSIRNDSIGNVIICLANGNTHIGYTNEITDLGFKLDVNGSINSASSGFSIAGTNVLNSTTLGSSIITSSLTSLGTTGGSPTFNTNNNFVLNSGGSNCFFQFKSSTLSSPVLFGTTGDNPFWKFGDASSELKIQNNNSNNIFTIQNDTGSISISGDLTVGSTSNYINDIGTTTANLYNGVVYNSPGELYFFNNFGSNVYRNVSFPFNSPSNFQASFDVQFPTSGGIGSANCYVMFGITKSNDFNEGRYILAFSRNDSSQINWSFKYNSGTTGLVFGVTQAPTIGLNQYQSVVITRDRASWAFSYIGTTFLTCEDTLYPRSEMKQGNTVFEISSYSGFTNYASSFYVRNIKIIPKYPISDSGIIHGPLFSNGDTFIKGNISVSGKTDLIDTTTNNLIVAGTCSVTGGSLSVSPGFVGIGNTAPTYPLHVVGSVSNSVTGGYFFNSTTSPTTFSTGSQSISIFSGSSILTQSSFLASSDERIKTGITSISDITAKSIIQSLNPVRYNYRDYIARGTDPVWGFIAQEVREHLDYAVSMEPAYLPNIYELGFISEMNNGTHLINISGSSGNTTTGITGNLKLISRTDNNLIVKVLDIPNITSVIVRSIPSLIGCTEIFVYGHEVTDFHVLNKDAIFTVAVAALQEVDRVTVANGTTIANLQEENIALSTSIATVLALLGVTG
jgi:hypothetical protein